MVKIHDPLFIGKAGSIVYIPTTAGGAISVVSRDGQYVNLHLADLPSFDAGCKADALASLDMLAAAVQDALLTLAPERFAQPEPECRSCAARARNPEALIISAGCDACEAHRIRSGMARRADARGDHDIATTARIAYGPLADGPDLSYGPDDDDDDDDDGFYQAHPMAENELRALAGDR
jgi:hypothetical protein